MGRFAGVDGHSAMGGEPGGQTQPGLALSERGRPRHGDRQTLQNKDQSEESRNNHTRLLRKRGFGIVARAAPQGSLPVACHCHEATNSQADNGYHVGEWAGQEVHEYIRSALH